MKSLLFAVALTAALAIPAQAQAQPKAMVVVTSAESPQCQFGNINVAWVLLIRNSDQDSRPERRYISSLDNHCVILPVTAPIGTHITVSGLLEIRGATNGLAPTVAEQCFNVEAYSIGLASGGDFGELDPQDPANIVNDQGFGLLWDMSDDISSTRQTFTFVVSGCGSGRCRGPKTVYNTDTGLIDSSGCAVLAPLS
jgi:hypothetical protein